MVFFCDSYLRCSPVDDTHELFDEVISTVLEIFIFVCLKSVVEEEVCCKKTVTSMQIVSRIIINNNNKHTDTF